ncbi:hypothetical protein PFICI_04095 [Pestalotiopsis fici W106-1]|uniref:Uncharacterized protein n=1 Tax=Pestalotiopsis fici (strain W106-1 / CGMCC3.15140) TaxID=1229662 RepID=W3XJ73_PESFW|nr:uncharacterized protein PFICI_04095 [Pestalotiopsis fici W106-1]ETS86070.1 hypothetical protein PFICI_04095 [Pestalotiopsis fici W106-1]
MGANDRDLRSLLVTVLGEAFVVSHARDSKKYYTTFAIKDASTDADECLEAHVFDFSEKNSTHRRFLENRILSKLLKLDVFVQDYSGALFRVVICRQKEDRTATPRVLRIARPNTGAAEDDSNKQLSTAASNDPIVFVARLCNNALLLNPRRSSSQLPPSLAEIERTLQDEVLSSWPSDGKVSRPLKPDGGQDPLVESSGYVFAPERAHDQQSNIGQRRTGGRHRLTPRDRRKHFVVDLATLIAKDGLVDKSLSNSMREPGLGFCIRHLTLPILDVHLPLCEKKVMAEKSRCWAKYLQRIQQQLPLLLKAAALEQKKTWASAIPTIITIFEATSKSGIFHELSLDRIGTQSLAAKKDHPDADLHSSETSAEKSSEKQEWKAYLNYVMSASFTRPRTTSIQCAIDILPLEADKPEHTDLAWRKILVWLGMIHIHHRMNIWAMTKPSDLTRDRPHGQDLRNLIQTYTMTQLVIGVQPIVDRMVRLAEEVAANWERVVNGQDIRDDNSVPCDIFKPLWHLRSRNLLETPTVIRGTALRTDEVEGNHPGWRSGNYEDLSLSGSADS